jgi:hypothetical protein
VNGSQPCKANAVHYSTLTSRSGDAADDHRFAAEEVKIGQCGSVSHAFRKAQHIAQGVFIAGIGEHSATAQNGTTGSVVYGYNSFEPGSPKGDCPCGVGLTVS